MAVSISRTRGMALKRGAFYRDTGSGVHHSWFVCGRGHVFLLKCKKLLCECFPHVVESLEDFRISPTVRVILDGHESEELSDCAHTERPVGEVALEESEHLFDGVHFVLFGLCVMLFVLFGFGVWNDLVHPAGILAVFVAPHPHELGLELLDEFLVVRETRLFGVDVVGELLVEPLDFGPVAFFYVVVLENMLALAVDELGAVVFLVLLAGLQLGPEAVNFGLEVGLVGVDIVGELVTEPLHLGPVVLISLCFLTSSLGFEFLKLAVKEVRAVLTGP